MNVPNAVHVSIVSHGQGGLVALLLDDLECHCRDFSLFVTITFNIPETVCFDAQNFSFPVKMIHNLNPKGFAANHNAAFRSELMTNPSSYFCVINPDIRFPENVFARLLLLLEGTSGVGVVAPLVRDPVGKVEDSGRRFPNLLTPLIRFLGANREPDYKILSTRIAPDWVAGMFLLFPSSVYELLGGFDERYFLYYEDIDLCARLRLKGYRVILEPATSVVHDAHRDSHHKAQYFWFHLRSIIRLFSSPLYWRAVRTPPVSS